MVFTLHTYIHARTKCADVLSLIAIHFHPDHAGQLVIIAMAYHMIDFTATTSLYFMVSHYCLKYLSLTISDCLLPVTVCSLYYTIYKWLYFLICSCFCNRFQGNIDDETQVVKKQPKHWLEI